MSASAKNAVVVIGYGSSLRGEDAAGRQVVELVADSLLPNVVAISVTQLVPELSARIATARAVIFVDACVEEDVHSVKVRQIASAPSALAASHTAAPCELLALARVCYGSTPPAWLVAIPAASFQMSEAISSAACDNIAAAVLAVERLVTELQENGVAHA